MSKRRLDPSTNVWQIRPTTGAKATMIEPSLCLKGTAKQIAEYVKSLQPNYPWWLLERLTPSEWYFIRCEEVVKINILEEKK